MLDFILGIYLAGLAVRGWLRGFVRELMDLVGLIVGTAIAFRLSGPFGGFLSDRFGVSPEWARIAAGITLFLLFGVSMTVVAHFLSKVARLPGLSLANRLLGSAVAAAWGALLVLVVVSIISVLPVPAAVDEAIEDSTVAQAIAGPDALPRRLLEPIVGDEAISALAAIERLTGGRRIVPSEGERVETETVDPDSVEADDEAAGFVFDRANADRLEAGADPLVGSDTLDALARDRAVEMYQGGYVGRRTPNQVLAATRDTNLRLQVAAEMTALASSERAAHAAIAESEDTALIDPSFDRIGVGVATGPLGTIVVEVYGR
ncbi:MAG TPA: CvpA family protein [Acidimicrobiia bacterium]|nr:CvpA family protein [Acidimicrobiia bacterium]